MAWLILLVVAWGALAFGAIYDWARWPLLVACAVAGATTGRWLTAGPERQLNAASTPAHPTARTVWLPRRNS